MTLEEAQREMRAVFVNGSVGQAVSGAIWLASAALATWGTTRQAIVALVVGGMFIYPLTQAALRLSGRRWAPSEGNPLVPLAMQTAFIVPLTLPVVGAAALHDVDGFYPAPAVVVGAHYLPFATLYGTRLYLALGGILIAGGVAIAFLVPDAFAPGGWFGGGMLVAFAAVAAARSRAGARSAAPA